MLRRVARFLLLAIGLLAPALIPLTSFISFEASSRWPSDQVALRAGGGTVNLTWYQDLSAVPYLARTSTVSAHVHAPRLPYLTLPEFYRGGFSSGLVELAFLDHINEPGFVRYTVFIPLWLLAVVCLAWPVTSFLLRRRRGLQGFDVEAKPAGSTPLPPGEADAQRSGADGEGGRQFAPEHHGGIN